MFVITPDQLRAAAPRCPNPERWAAALNDAMLLHGIAADVDFMVEFLAQCAHESAEFTRLEESLHYTPERLMAVWPKRFPTLAKAAEYAGRPHALAEYVYGGRMGNRPEGSGDGWNYRGRGAIMVTGRANYAKVDKMLGGVGLLGCPDMLRTAPTAAMAAAAWWASDPALNRLADDLPDDDDHADFVAITRKVNGGTVGLAHRAKLRDAFSLALRGRK